MARTIDNLGLDVSTQYAESRADYDESLLAQSRAIQSQATVDVTLPFMPSEFESLFGLGQRGAFWPQVFPPRNYDKSRRNLFSQDIAPSLGSAATRHNQMHRLEGLGKREAGMRQDAQEVEAIHRETQTLVKLFENLGIASEYLLEINARRNQYKKG